MNMKVELHNSAGLLQEWTCKASAIRETLHHVVRTCEFLDGDTIRIKDVSEG